MWSLRILAWSLLVALSTNGVAASPISFCPNNQNVCLQWAVPEAEAQHHLRNVYFQIKAPISYQWIGLGMGNQMAGAFMFIMYTDGNGNVTLSTRAGRGHSMPQPVQDDKVVLLGGSGVKDGQMVANVLYKNSGDLDTSRSSDWIMAQKTGASLDSADLVEQISQHDSHSNFKVNLASASIKTDVNPFVQSEDNGDGHADTPSPPHSGQPEGVTVTNDNPNGDLIFAHGIIMTVVFIAIYPLGSVIIPLLGKWYLHAGWQMTGFLLMWAGFGVGYVVSNRLDNFFDQAHTRLGVFVAALLGIQPTLGLLHHLDFRRNGKRGLLSHAHAWYGRILITLGVINGGLGVKLSGASDAYVLGYSVAAGISTLLYLSSSVYRVFNEKKNG